MEDPVAAAAAAAAVAAAGSVAESFDVGVAPYAVERVELFLGHPTDGKHAVDLAGATSDEVNEVAPTTQQIPEAADAPSCRRTRIRAS